jgi:hypothetical protein
MVCTFVEVRVSVIVIGAAVEVVIVVFWYGT